MQVIHTWGDGPSNATEVERIAADLMSEDGDIRHYCNIEYDRALIELVAVLRGLSPADYRDDVEARLRIIQRSRGERTCCADPLCPVWGNKYLKAPIDLDALRRAIEDEEAAD